MALSSLCRIQTTVNFSRMAHRLDTLFSWFCLYVPAGKEVRPNSAHRYLSSWHSLISTLLPHQDYRVILVGALLN
jgi:hypothetical protein